MEKKKNKDVVRFVSSYRTSEGVIYEMTHTQDKPTIFLRCGGGGSKEEVKSIKTVAGEVLCPLPAHSPLLVHSIVSLPTACGVSSTIGELVQRIEQFLRQWIYLQDTEYLITAYYIVMTWIYDDFDAVPYLRVRGDFGSGKTRFLTVVGSLCNKAIFTSGASTVAPLFHLLHQLAGTLILDEADFRFSSETAEITKILNNGNASGFPVLRCQKTKSGQFETVAYTVYGPKIIASRGLYQDEALESRCISFEMGCHKGDIGSVPLSLPDDFGVLATKLRNDLLAFRFDNLGKIKTSASLKMQGVSNRLRQVYAPFFSICSNDGHKEQLVTYAKEQHAQQLADRGLSTESEMLKVMQELTYEGCEALSIADLCARFKKKYGSNYERTITPKWIGSIVRGKLLLATRKSNGRYVICENQKTKIEALCERFDV